MTPEAVTLNPFYALVVGFWRRLSSWWAGRRERSHARRASILADVGPETSGSNSEYELSPLKRPHA